MEQLVYNTIIRENLIKKGDKIVLGVSGGPDSMALLYSLYNMKDELQIELVAVHINHGVRGFEADSDEEYVKDICEKLDIPFYCKRVDMDAYAKQKKMSSEEAGRELRYAFFSEVLQKVMGDKIAVAHNKNDQAETVMMRFLRGTGIEGLKGMQYKIGNVIRPLLDVERKMIEEYCMSNNISARTDKTNFQPIYGRNKIRLKVIPYIEDNINKGIIGTLTRTASIMKEDNEFLNDCAKAKFDYVCTVKPKSILIDVDKFTTLHKAMKSRILRNAITIINGSSKNIGLKHIDNMIEFIEDGESGRIHDTTMNLELLKKYDACILRNKKLKVTKNQHDKQIVSKLESGLNSCCDSFDCNIVINVNDIQKIDFKSNHRFIKYIDYDKIKGDLYIRNRKPGDKFIPFGMKGNKKLKDYFIDNKVPREERDNIPIIVDDKNIIWVIGYRLSDLYKVDKNTKNVMSIQYIAKEDFND